jgi:hypothetical protein
LRGRSGYVLIPLIGNALTLSETITKASLQSPALVARIRRVIMDVVKIRIQLYNQVKENDVDDVDDEHGEGVQNSDDGDVEDGEVGEKFDIDENENHKDRIMDFQMNEETF